MGFWQRIWKRIGCTKNAYYHEEDDESQYLDSIAGQEGAHSKGNVASAVAKFENQKPTKQSKGAIAKEKEASRSANFWIFSSATDKQQQKPPPATKLQSPLTSLNTKIVVCSVCQKRVYPTEHQAHREKSYHVSCFKCSECGCRLKNTSEAHDIRTDSIGVYCKRCAELSEHKLKPRVRGTVAGTKTVVDEAQKGDIEGVKGNIGDDLEEALQKMVPRCAICGGDFLKYRGEISSEGSLKYHSECLRGEKPPGVSLRNTLSPAKAAKYLPERIVIKLSANGQILATLFFVWTDKADAMKNIRSKKSGGGSDEKGVSIEFHLDEEAWGNPNFKGDSKKRKTTARIPPIEKERDGNKHSFDAEIVGGDQLAKQPPSLVEPVSIVSKEKQLEPLLRARLAYANYNLKHLVGLEVPCDLSHEELDLTRAVLTVQIEAP